MFATHLAGLPGSWLLPRAFPGESLQERFSLFLVFSLRFLFPCLVLLTTAGTRYARKLTSLGIAVSASVSRLLLFLFLKGLSCCLKTMLESSQFFQFFLLLSRVFVFSFSSSDFRIQHSFQLSTVVSSALKVSNCSAHPPTHTQHVWYNIGLSDLVLSKRSVRIQVLRGALLWCFRFPVFCVSRVPGCLLFESICVRVSVFLFEFIRGVRVPTQDSSPFQDPEFSFRTWVFCSLVCYLTCWRDPFCPFVWRFAFVSVSFVSIMSPPLCSLRISVSGLLWCFRGVSREGVFREGVFSGFALKIFIWRFRGVLFIRRFDSLKFSTLPLSSYIERVSPQFPCLEVVFPPKSRDDSLYPSVDVCWSVCCFVYTRDAVLQCSKFLQSGANELVLKCSHMSSQCSPKLLTSLSYLERGLLVFCQLPY